MEPISSKKILRKYNEAFEKKRIMFLKLSKN